MDIHQIAKTVAEHVQEGKLTFCDESIGVPNMVRLFYYHMSGKSSFDLNHVTYKTEADTFLLWGNGIFPDGTSCRIGMEFTEEKDGSLCIEMQEQYFLAFLETSFRCRCVYKSNMWMITFYSEEEVRFAALLADSLRFLGISVPAACFGTMGTVSDLNFRFELPFAETRQAKGYSLTQDNFTNISLENYFSLSFKTDVKLDLSGIFEGGNQVLLGLYAFCIEKFGDRCGFSFDGMVKLWDLEVPFVIRYDSEQFRLSTKKDKKSSLKIPSVNELGKIVGIEDLKLPDSLSGLTEFEVESISLVASSDFSRLYSFGVVLSNPNQWRLAQTPDLCITNLKVGFTKKLLQTSVFIGGDITIDQWTINLSSAYDTVNGWIFRCYIANDRKNPLELKDLFRKLSNYLGFSEMPFPLPSLEFIGAMISFNLKTKRFSARMEIGKLDCTFDYMFGEKKTYHLDLKIGYEIPLSKIPIVGTDLHLLDSAVIRNINLVSDSSSTVLNLEFAGKPLKLELSGKSTAEEMRRIDQSERLAVSILWFRLEQRFSVFTIHRLGLGYDGKKIIFALDAELVASALSLGVEGMEVSLEVADRVTPSFDLAGLSVGFSNPALSISGGFRHSVTEGIDFYDGVLKIAVKEISILAMGSYSDRSFLAYGIVRAKIGGPPAFFITGLAVGFGLNKYLELPQIEEVETYPLVAAAMNPAVTPGELLAGIKSRIFTQPGQNFLAAGVSFQSFGMASSFVLLTVSFGKNLEIGVLGLSKMTVPPMTEKNPIAKATLALKAAILPDQGLLSVEARLMEDSYILSRSCRITGGFAFYLWFGQAHKGDFVITLGGYRKGYRKPEHYPDVPRLGFCWCVTKELTISGEMYFALTPSMICAGGRLDAVFQLGALRTWFIAYADIEIGWKPFSYELAIGISLGVSITLDFWLFSTTFTLEMSVDLYIKGPEFGGNARVKWWIISFTISFGEEVTKVDTIEWDEFKKTFLQEKVVSIQAVSGVIGTRKIIDQGVEKEMEILNADAARFTVESLVPSTEITVNGQKNLSDTREALGVLPMGEVILDSPLMITLSELTKKEQGMVSGKCQVESLKQNVPKALWAKKKNEKNSRLESGELISDSITGASLRLEPKAIIFFPARSFLTLDLLSEYEKIEKKFMYTSVLMPDIQGIDVDFKTFKKSADEIGTKVGAFAKKMKEAGFDFDYVPDLAIMAENAENWFDEEIMLAGGNWYGAQD